MQPSAARDFYARQQRVAQTTANEVRRIWRGRMGDDFDASWRRIAPAVLAVVVEGQLQMARASQTYVGDVLDQQGIPDRPAGELVPESLAGMASDGRRLDTLAQQSVVTAKVAVGSGATTDQALNSGGDFLHLMAQLQVADTARVAVGIGTTVRRDIAGHVRVLNPPVCQRCAILGGRFYRWSEGFDRHPRDDCTMMPVRSAAEAQAEGLMNDPMAAYRAGWIKDLTEAQVRAIEEGAKLNQVVNAYRGMGTTATETQLSARKLHLLEKERTARAAEEAQRQARVAAFSASSSSAANIIESLNAQLRGLPRADLTSVRLTPEGIYRLAGHDRAEAIRLLRSEGYIT